MVQTQDEFSFQAPNSKDSVSMLGFTKDGEMTFVKKNYKKVYEPVACLMTRACFIFVHIYVIICIYLLMNCNSGDTSCG